MKKLLCIVLTVLMLLPVVAFGDVEGVTVSDFVAWMEQCPDTYSLIKEHEGRQIFAIINYTGGVLTVSNGFSFVGSDTLEFTYLMENEHSTPYIVVWFMSATSEATDANERVSAVSGYSNSLIELLSDPDFEAEAWNRSIKAGSFYLDALIPPDNESGVKAFYLWLNSASDLANKTAALAYYDFDEYPTTEAALIAIDALSSVSE